MGIFYPVRIQKNDPNEGKEPFDEEGNDLSVPVPGHPEWANEQIDPTTGWSMDIVEPLVASTYMIDGDVWRYTDEGKVINPGGGVQGENRPYEPLFDGDWEFSPGIEPLDGVKIEKNDPWGIENISHLTKQTFIASASDGTEPLFGNEDELPPDQLTILRKWFNSKADLLIDFADLLLPDAPLNSIQNELKNYFDVDEFGMINFNPNKANNIGIRELNEKLMTWIVNNPQILTHINQNAILTGSSELTPFYKPEIVKEKFFQRFPNATERQWQLARKMIMSSASRGRNTPTTSAALSLFSARPDQFVEVGSIEAAQEAAQSWMKNNNRKTLVGYDGSRITVGGHYFKMHVKKGQVVSTPYNKYMTSVHNAWSPPPDLIKKLRSLEGTPLTGTEGFGVVPTQMGRTTQVQGMPVIRRFPPGTVDKFLEWYKGLIEGQKGEQHFYEQLNDFYALMGADKYNRGKGTLSKDISHFKARSKGGAGFGFLEAWIVNQKRKDLDILDDSAMLEAGIPLNWEQLFYRWLAGDETLLGPLDDINVNDFFSVERGQSIDSVVARRGWINSAIETAKGDPTQIPVLQSKFNTAMQNATGNTNKTFSLAKEAGFEKIDGIYVPIDTEADILTEEADMLNILPPGQRQN